MAYFILLIALGLEVVGTSLAKVSDGMSKWQWGIGAYGCYALSIYMFSLALRRIDLAVADTIWQGVGIVLICLVSALLFHEQISWLQYLFIGVTIVGVVGLGWAS